MTRRSFVAAPALGLLTTLIATASFGADYYVATNGSDTAAGSSTAPWRTIQKAADTVAPGSVVHVRAGTYAGFQMTRDATAANPIVFRADPSVLVNLPNSETPDNINIENADYITVEGFTVEDAPRIGIRAVNATGVIIKNNVVRRSGRTGILTGWTPALQVIGNVSSAAGEEHGIYVANSNTRSDNVIIRGNETFGNTKNGIQINGDCMSGGDGIIEGVLVENNHVHDNNWKGFSIISVQFGVFQNNLVHDNGISAGAGGIHLADEPGCGKPSSNNLVVNNTVVEPRIACIRMTEQSTSNVIFNNLCVAGANDKLILDDAGGNLISSASNVRRTSSTGIFVGAGADNYHLASGSNVINTGEASYQGRPAPSADMEANARPAGGAPDPGAYEFGSTGGGDVVPPVATLTSPAPGATLESQTPVTATATDNVGIASVEFMLDGVALGPLDTAAPYSTSLDATAYPSGFYTLSARARDAAGNVGTTAPVSVYIRNGSSSSGIPSEHPRISLVGGELERLRGQACYDDNGNPIPGCTPTAYATRFLDYVRNEPGKAETWQHAMAYMITGEDSFANLAIQEADDIVACDWQCPANSHKHFLYIRDYLRSVALVYDWLHDRLTAQQRAAYINYMNKMLYLVWNDTPEANAIYDTRDWSTSNPRNNFYYNYLLATAYVALATDGENNRKFTHNGVTYDATFPMESRTPGSPRWDDPFEFMLAKMDQQMWPALARVGKGGGWHEGENYGRMSKRHLLEALLLLKQTAGLDYFNDPAHPFAREALYYELYTCQPGGGVLYPGGDQPNDPAAHIGAYDRHIMLLLAEGMKGTVESQYAQFWCNTVRTRMDGISVMIPVDFLLTDPTLPQRDYSELDTRYLAEGTGWAHSRSSWDDDAVAVTFVSTDRLQGHQHRDQNAFVIYKGGNEKRVNGWLLTDIQPYSSGLPNGTVAHNTILIDRFDQRFGDGTGKIARFEAAPGYTYALGDASDAYWSNPEPYGPGDDKMVDVFHRELVHIMPGYVVAFDRLSMNSQFTGSDVRNVFHFPLVQPTPTAGTFMTTSDDVRLFHKVLLPASATIAWVDEEAQSSDNRNATWRMEIKDPSVRPSYQFLNVFFATTATTAAMPPTDKVTSESGNMVGAVIKDPAQEHVVMFSTDPAGGAPVGNIIYEVGVNGQSQHSIFDLVPGAGYSIAIGRGAGSVRVSIAAGGPHMASSAGSLSFTPDEIQSPTAALATR